MSALARRAAGADAAGEVRAVSRFVIRGGRPLQGTVRVGGAKNAALPLLAAALLAERPCVLHHVPWLRDVESMLRILRALGAEVEVGEPGPQGRTVAVRVPRLATCAVPPELMRRMRSSLFVLGPLLARCGRAVITYPGGCNIGSRPIDLHLRGLAMMGARIEEAGGLLSFEALRLRGAEIHLDVPSVGATENLVMAATLAEGTTVIRNAAKEPEVVDLQNFLNRLGARVRGAGTDAVVVEGVARLGAAEHEVIPDRIEAGTYLVAGAITGGDVTVADVVPEHLQALMAKLREAGFSVDRGPGWVRVRARGRPRATNVKTLPYPGFPTDLQNPFLALMCLAEGTSVISESIWDNRFKVADELRRMGARIQVEGRVAVVHGVARLTGAEVEAHDDLRGAMSLVLAALAADGASTVAGAEYVYRGYQDPEAKLAALGADIVLLPG